MEKVRGFEVVKGLEDKDIRLPERSTKNSAGYDFFAYEDVEIEPVFFDVLGKIFKGVFGLLSLKDNIKDLEIEIKPTIVWTGVKSYMLEDEYLGLYNRSSNPKKLGLVLANGVGIVDSDYYNNSDNDGNLGFAFYNILPWKVKIKKGGKIGQGVFHKFLKVDNDAQNRERIGGYGSTGE